MNRPQHVFKIFGWFHGAGVGPIWQPTTSVHCGLWLLEQDGRYVCSGYGQGLTAVWGGAKADAYELSGRHFVCSPNFRLPVDIMLLQ